MTQLPHGITHTKSNNNKNKYGVSKGCFKLATHTHTLNFFFVVVTRNKIKRTNFLPSMCHIVLRKRPLSTWMNQLPQKRACGLLLAGLKEMEITLSSQLNYFIVYRRPKKRLGPAA